LSAGGAGARRRKSGWWRRRWRRQLGARQGVNFAPVRIAPEIAAADLVGHGAIEIEFATGARMRITGAVAPAMVTAAVAALAEGRRR